MNEYDEQTWSAEQRNLDGRILLEFEALESSRSVHEETGQPVEAWLVSAKDTAKALRAQMARIAHAGRRQHWEAELQRIGLAAEPAPEPPKPAPVAAETPSEPEPPRRRGGMLSHA